MHLVDHVERSFQKRTPHKPVTSRTTDIRQGGKQSLVNVSSGLPPRSCQGSGVCFPSSEVSDADVVVGLDRPRREEDQWANRIGWLDRGTH